MIWQQEKNNFMCVGEGGNKDKAVAEETFFVWLQGYQ